MRNGAEVIITERRQRFVASLQGMVAIGSVVVLHMPSGVRKHCRRAWDLRGAVCRQCMGCVFTCTTWVGPVTFKC